jgi:hypothetical protein
MFTVPGDRGDVGGPGVDGAPGVIPRGTPCISPGGRFL